METLSSSLAPSEWINIAHASDVALARRAGQNLAQALALNETRAGQLAIMVSEAATNILKHAGEGRMLLAIVNHGGRRCVEVLAIDQGPGIANAPQAMLDGVSSTGTSGTGLGAMRRLADQFELYAPADKGAVVFMRLWADAEANALSPLRVGGVCLPIAGESVSGDAWAALPQPCGITLLAADGLGHGAEAAKAAQAAVEVLGRAGGHAPGELVEQCHQALRPTRGAALAVATLDVQARQLRFAGIGNISACLYADDGRRQLMSHNGIVGHNVRKVHELAFPCPPGATLVLASDGLSSQWDLSPYPGLLAREPAIIAAVLLRDFTRGRDDASVLVATMPGEP